jgi:glycosyltransferase involved in cell wall biosynthesis
MNPLKVALVTRNLSVGGAQQHLVKLCQTVSPSEVQLSLFLLIRDEGADLLAGMPPHVRVHTSPLRRHHPLVLKWLADGLRCEGIELVQSFLWHADVTAALSKGLFRWGPFIISERGDRADEAYANPSGLRRRIDRWLTFRTCQWACANSKYGQDLLISLGCSAAKVSYIPNGINLAEADLIPAVSVRQAQGWPDTAVVVGMASRLVAYKGVETFIRALAQFHETDRVYGVIVGDGPQREALERLAREIGLARRLLFMGQQTPAAAVIKDWDIGVLSSQREGFSNSILEYMACAKPVIATAVGGTPELVNADDTGILIPSNDPEILAAAIRRMRDHPGRAIQMGQRGRARVEREFSMEVVARHFVRLWQAVRANGE